MNREYYEKLYYSEEISDNAKILIEDILIKIADDIKEILNEIDGIKGITEVDYTKEYLEKLYDKL